MDPYAKVKPGDVLPGLPGAPWNDMLDVVGAFKEGRIGGLGGAGLGRLAEGVVPIRNDSNSDLPRFGILGITGFLIDPSSNLAGFKNRPTMKGGAPVLTDSDRLVITQQPCRQGAICDGLLIGITPVQINVIDTSDNYADLIVGDVTKLQSQSYGSAWIIFKESGTGIKWGLIAHGIHPVKTLRAKTTHSLGPMTSNGSFPADIYVGTPGSETQPAGNPTVTNIWNGTQCTINSGKMMTLLLVAGGPWWHVVEADTS